MLFAPWMLCWSISSWRIALPSLSGSREPGPSPIWRLWTWATSGWHFKLHRSHPAPSLSWSCPLCQASKNSDRWGQPWLPGWWLSRNWSGMNSWQCSLMGTCRHYNPIPFHTGRWFQTACCSPRGAVPSPSTGLYYSWQSADRSLWWFYQSAKVPGRGLLIGWSLWYFIL